MNVLILHNPSSGTGSRRALVDESEQLLRADGHEVSRMAPIDAGASDEIAHAELVVLAGGDGTVHHALPALVRSRAAMYHLPLGTENLFARHFGMDRHAVTLRRAVANPPIAEIDLGEANGRFFALVVSAGPDAGVIHDLASTRTGPISHLTYLAPMMRELRRTPAPLWIEADGTTIVQDRPGWAVVANLPDYAMRANPAPRADATDGLLDIVFMPASSTWRALRWFLAGRWGHAERHPDRVCVRASRVRIATSPGAAAPVQIDGEPFIKLADTPRDGFSDVLDVVCRRNALRVLLPRTRTHA
jgi:diacylglycerol kinase family enzyme